MKTRELGGSRLKVSAIGFGCMGLNFSYSHALSKAESITLIRQAVARGDLLRHRRIYGPFTNEEIVGEALKPVRDQVVLRPSSASTSSMASRRALTAAPSTSRRSPTRP